MLAVELFARWSTQHRLFEQQKFHKKQNVTRESTSIHFIMLRPLETECVYSIFFFFASFISLRTNINQMAMTSAGSESPAARHHVWTDICYWCVEKAKYLVVPW